MTPSNNLSVLPFYDSIEQQNHRKSFAFDNVFQLLMPNRTILPFQILRASSSSQIASVMLISCDTGISYNITSTLQSNGLTIIPDANDNMDVIIWNGSYQVPSFVENGTYYIQLIAGQVWYSDMFTLTGNAGRYMMVEWWDEKTHYFDGGHIFYDGNFRHRLYLDTELGKPEYPFDETGSDRDGYFFPEKQISEKRYKFNFIAPEYLTDAIRLIRLRDFVHVTNKGNLFVCDTFMSNVSWQTQGDLASVDCEFETFTVVKKIPDAAYSSGGGGGGGTTPSFYSVYVISAGVGSTGSGQFNAGAAVAIYAGAPPSGQQFSHWVSTSAGVVFGNSNSPTTTFIMPANSVTVTAVFEGTIQSYTVTVISAGTGASPGGNYAVGSYVGVSAGTPPSGQQFSHWDATGIVLALPSASPTGFTMPANNVVLTANFIPIINNQFLVTVTSAGTGATGGGLYIPGSIVTVYSGTPPSGKTFIGWGATDVGTLSPNPHSPTVSFTMPSQSVTMEAVFGNTVTVNSIGLTASGGGVYSQGTIVTIYAGTPPAGQQFKNWTASGVILSNANAESTSFVMPANNVIVTANFESTVQYFNVTVISNGIGASTGGNYAVGSYVGINAGTAPSGFQFKNWTASGVVLVLPTSNPAAFNMPANNVTLTANFEQIVNNNFLVTVSSVGNGATGGGYYTAGSTVTVYAGSDPAGRQFIGWASAAGVYMNPNQFSRTITFIMPSQSVTMQAVFGSTVTVVSTGTGATGGGVYEEGDMVYVFCGVPPAGKTFTGWTTSSPGVSIQNANNTTANFVMPNNSVAITANFS